jgi:hypothetical protein
MKLLVKLVSPVNCSFLLLTLKWSLQDFVLTRLTTVFVHKFHIYTKWRVKLLSCEKSDYIR